MKMISGGRKRVPAPLTCETREGNDRCCADRLQPRNSTSVAEWASRWLDRGSGMYSWEHGNKSSRRGLADRDSDPRSTVKSVAHESLYHHAPTKGCVR
ncbi:hypothetical protein TNCV_1010211 [Trichonephila clavipes]|nr:hypothetical protein TNCV_1010211 [Trichonephila clavipes]